MSENDNKTVESVEAARWSKHVGPPPPAPPSGSPRPKMESSTSNARMGVFHDAYHNRHELFRLVLADIPLLEI
ncbi:uncharacterized protein N7506_011061 [Penicillium brevicompactum]|uniref:uncharacterized protein n=1 Tax=Penicillium brevicompactum TaxID=5074 RepID=UPI002540BD56|nr:uncharacterized protein N7506_011061 [Penicillium brevicompactum]KAJ5321931.1 hypothetical protein N7506_011061 [Penicillium brevicompactum]